MRRSEDRKMERRRDGEKDGGRRFAALYLSLLPLHLSVFETGLDL
jgi:hypothetical protein